MSLTSYMQIRQLTGRGDSSRVFDALLPERISSSRSVAAQDAIFAAIWRGGVCMQTGTHIISLDHQFKQLWVYPLLPQEFPETFFYCSEEEVVVAQSNSDYTQFISVTHEGVVQEAKRINGMALMKGFFEGLPGYAHALSFVDAQYCVSSLDLKTLSVQHEKIGEGFSFFFERDLVLSFKNYETNENRTVFFDKTVTIKPIFYAPRVDAEREWAIEMDPHRWCVRNHLSGARTSGPFVGNEECREEEDRFILSHQGQKGLMICEGPAWFFVNIAADGHLPQAMQGYGWPEACIGAVVVTSTDEGMLQILDCRPCFEGELPRPLIGLTNGHIIQFTKDFLFYYDALKNTPIFVDLRK